MATEIEKFLERKSDLIDVDRDSLLKVLQLYNSDLTSIQCDIDAIKKWLKTQPHLPEIPGDKHIASFLILSKMSVEQAKQKIDWYYTTKTVMPEIFNYHPLSEDMQEHAKKFYYVLCPKLTPDMYRITLFQLIPEYASEADFLKVAIYMMLMVEVRLLEDYGVGEIHIFDAKNMGLNFYKNATPALFIKLATIGQKVFSSRIKAIHIVNMNPILDKFMSTVVTFMKPKVRQRIFFHKNFESILKQVPKEYLPKDLGGDQKSCAELREINQQKFVEYKDRFQKLLELKTDESLRPGEPINDEFLGFHGNFKQLSVD